MTDAREALRQFAPGVVPTRETDDALAAAQQAHGGTLTEADLRKIVGTPPAALTRLPPVNGGV